MHFFCYHRDRPGSTPLRVEMVEEHWSYMDGYGAALIARGPTFHDDQTLTGSLHVVDLPDASAARAFAFDEPCYQAGAYRDVLVRRTRWEPAGDHTGAGFLVIGFTSRPESPVQRPQPRGDLIGHGPLLSDDGAHVVGAAALLGAPDAEAALACIDADRFAAVEVHRWERGGRR